ncbi:MAG: molybdopterin-dependent oxidoreductase [Eggerthellaceae bacterium]
MGAERAFQQIAGNQNRTNEWAKGLDFVVVQDIWHTPSVDWADIVLPVCSHFEVDEEIGFLRALRGHVLLQQKVLDPLFESKTDFGSIERWRSDWDTGMRFRRARRSLRVFNWTMRPTRPSPA